VAREAARLAGRDDPAMDAVLAEPLPENEDPSVEVSR
jgi:hypothetical protein